ncbi:MAG: DUF3800 domain-containing protein [Planctomycetota bacterium]|jgi:hypothetical protein
MLIYFADDSRQRKPTAEKMGPLVAIGGICIADENLRNAITEIDSLCAESGFPPGEEFKWSPGRELWMRNNLKGSGRLKFFLSLLEILKDKEVKVTVIISEEGCETATKADSCEFDIANMFIERVDRQFKQRRTQGLIVVDRPGGGRRSEDTFLAKCLETLQSGTEYVKPTNIAHNIFLTPSKLSRMLQAADVVTSCALARVSGETLFSPAVFKEELKLLYRDGNRIGGVGLKIHPDYKYANLYHWILNDSHFLKGMRGIPYPLKWRPYSSGPLKY